VLLTGSLCCGLAACATDWHDPTVVYRVRDPTVDPTVVYRVRCKHMALAAFVVG